MTFQNLQVRVKTALVLSAVLFVLYLLSLTTNYASWLFFLVTLFCTLVCSWEYSLVCTSEKNDGIYRYLLLSVLLFPLLSVSTSLTITAATVATQTEQIVGLYKDIAIISTLCSVAGSFLVTFIYGVYVARDDLSELGKVMQDFIPGVFQIGLGGSLLIAITMLSGYQWLLLWLLLVVFSNDSAAYFAGSKFQGPKLAPAISPNKTLSGSVGGVVGGVIVGVFFGPLLLKQQFSNSILDLALLSTSLVICGQLGDLVKSYVKRLHAVKDTGSILPGHGGLLDRIDGLLLAAPFFYIALLLN
ncbi:MAG: phosphatidate cytidylyltransferase [Deltaproteobacteria bacterium]|nr:phosphatidate cytidylyltransferase [Deltaproteobacteria bacterium]